MTRPADHPRRNRPHRRASGALWWEEARLLCVADLHLGKSERLARRGGTLLPPYETEETLARLAAEVERARARTVVCLGDSFDDSAAGAGLDARRGGRPAGDRGRAGLDLGGRQPRPRRADARRARGARGVASGPSPSGTGRCGGRQVRRYPGTTIRRCGFRCGARSVSRPCFLYDARRVILPAFGAYTGGLRAEQPGPRPAARRRTPARSSPAIPA